MLIRVVSGKMEELNPMPSMINLGFLSKTVAASLVGLPLMIGSVSAAEPSTPPMPNPQIPAESSSVQQLSSMFSPQIQSTIQACWDNGRADLGAGAGPDGTLLCSDGESVDIPYTSYLNTVSDIFVASSLIGFRAAIASNAQVSPEMLAAFIANPDGAALLQNTVQMAVRQSQLVNPSSVESANVLTSEIVTRITPVLSDPTQLDHLLGTPEQYSQVVQNFCTAPGMSVEQAQSLVPGMTPIQLYAVCVNESGVANEMMRLIN